MACICSSGGQYTYLTPSVSCSEHAEVVLGGSQPGGAGASSSWSPGSFQALQELRPCFQGGHQESGATPLPNSCGSPCQGATLAPGILAVRNEGTSQPCLGCHKLPSRPSAKASVTLREDPCGPQEPLLHLCLTSVHFSQPPRRHAEGGGERGSPRWQQRSLTAQGMPRTAAPHLATTDTRRPSWSRPHGFHPPAGCHTTAGGPGSYPPLRVSWKLHLRKALPAPPPYPEQHLLLRGAGRVGGRD